MKYPGVFVGADSNAQITNCEIYNHLADGIWIKDNAKCKKDGCKIHDNVE